MAVRVCSALLLSVLLLAAAVSQGKGAPLNSPDEDSVKNGNLDKPFKTNAGNPRPDVSQAKIQSEAEKSQVQAVKSQADGKHGEKTLPKAEPNQEKGPPEAGNAQEKAPLVGGKAQEQAQPEAGKTQEQAQPEAGKTQEQAQPKAGETQEQGQPKAGETQGQPKAGETQEQGQPKAGETQPKAGEAQPKAGETQEEAQPKAGETQEEAQPKAGETQEEEDNEETQPEDDDEIEDNEDNGVLDMNLESDVNNDIPDQQEKSPSGNQENSVFQEESESSHFFAYLVTSAILVAVLYIAYHNKRKIIAFAIEGRRSKGGRRPNSGEYQRLDHKI